MYMATAAQMAANRLNSLKSLGPRSEEGKAVSRFNALKSGVHAKSQVIPGEESAPLGSEEEGDLAGKSPGSLENGHWG
jgi:hypothetical protein